MSNLEELFQNAGNYITNMDYNYQESPTTTTYTRVAAQDNPDYAQMLGDIHRWGDVNRADFDLQLSAINSARRNQYNDKLRKEQQAREDAIRAQAKAERDRDKKQRDDAMAAALKYQLEKNRKYISTDDTKGWTNSSNVVNPELQDRIDAYNAREIQFSDNPYMRELEAQKFQDEMDAEHALILNDLFKDRERKDRLAENQVKYGGEDAYALGNPYKDYGFSKKWSAKDKNTSQVIASDVNNPLVSLYKEQNKQDFFRPRTMFTPRQENNLKFLSRNMRNTGMRFINNGWNSEIGKEVQSALTSIVPDINIENFVPLLNDRTGEYFIFNTEDGNLIQIREDGQLANVGKADDVTFAQNFNDAMGGIGNFVRDDVTPVLQSGYNSLLGLFNK